MIHMAQISPVLSEQCFMPYAMITFILWRIACYDSWYIMVTNMLPNHDGRYLQYFPNLGFMNSTIAVMLSDLATFLGRRGLTVIRY